MMYHRLPKQYYIGLLLCVLLLAWSRGHALHFSDHQTYQLSGEMSLVAEKILSGSVAGLVADFRVLDVFSSYYHKSSEGDKNGLRYIAPYLLRANNLDPHFFDVYRLAASMLAYDAKQPQVAVSILAKGIDARPDSWEIPLYAGFIAHDQLHDDALAFSMLQHVVEREGVPSLIVGLASKFLENSATQADAISFLQGLLQVLPKEQHEGIKNRIRELQSEPPGSQAL